jgi:hypothetical protein
MVKTRVQTIKLAERSSLYAIAQNATFVPASVQLRRFALKKIPR